jgi:hypothetical protein
MRLGGGVRSELGCDDRSSDKLRPESAGTPLCCDGVPVTFTTAAGAEALGAWGGEARV